MAHHDPAASALRPWPDRKSTRLNSSHSQISYAVFCLKKKNIHEGCYGFPRFHPDLRSTALEARVDYAAQPTHKRLSPLSRALVIAINDSSLHDPLFPE